MTYQLGKDVRAVIDALEEPTLIVRRGNVIAANGPARQLFGRIHEGSDVRLVIRHPQVLELLLPAVEGRIDVSGIGDFSRSWTVIISALPADSVLVRLIDRSAMIAAERMRVDFVANASHELRTPLATIIGYAETLAADDQPDEEVRVKFGNTLQSEAKRMLRIVEDLMSLSRIAADKFVPPVEQAKLSDVVSSAISNVSAAYALGDFEMLVDVPEDLPPVQGDYGQLEQAVENLLSNALRYSGAGSTIKVAASRSERHIDLIVADNGIGIPREHLPRLTERFYRVDPARSRQSGGTGLGLAIVKHIVERHKGALRIESEIGEGTKITVTLPVADAL